MGASFIGLEVAASLRMRGLDVHVVAPEARPLERILGEQLGDLVRSWHESRGVAFHLGQTAVSVSDTDVTLKDGSTLAADLVVIGVGVRPVVALAEQAQRVIYSGGVVDEFMETSVPRNFAAGDNARWPDQHTGASIRVEHWVVAQRQGQTAAKNMLGKKERHDPVPFFWSAHYEHTISYVGHAEKWDSIVVDGDLQGDDATVTMSSVGQTLAVVTIGRDLESLRAEAAMEHRA
jgi:NADPH-dependent 2,4-dienoyl-CoA reductase/sulfur reductase-like enzyme